MTNRLDGKVALISGGARGIGGATAKMMAAAGASVVVGDVLADKAKETVKEIIAAGGKAMFVPLDVTSEKDWTAAVAAATKAYGKLDILVNNAGLFLGRDFEDVTLDEWHKLVSVNLTGVWLGTKLCTPALKASGASSKHGSAIVNLEVGGQAVNLVPAAVGQDGPLPAFEAVQAAEAAQHVQPRPQPEVEGVAEDDLRAHRLERGGQHALHRAVSAHRHEHRRLDETVGERQPAAAGPPFAAENIELEHQPDCRSGSGMDRSSSIASP